MATRISVPMDRPATATIAVPPGWSGSPCATASAADGITPASISMMVIAIAVQSATSDAGNRASGPFAAAGDSAERRALGWHSRVFPRPTHEALRRFRSPRRLTVNEGKERGPCREII